MDGMVSLILEFIPSHLVYTPVQADNQVFLDGVGICLKFQASDLAAVFL